MLTDQALLKKSQFYLQNVWLEYKGRGVETVDIKWNPYQLFCLDLVKTQMTCWLVGMSFSFSVCTSLQQLISCNERPEFLIRIMRHCLDLSTGHWPEESCVSILQQHHLPSLKDPLEGFLFSLLAAPKISVGHCLPLEKIMQPQQSHPWSDLLHTAYCSQVLHASHCSHTPEKARPIWGVGGEVCRGVRTLSVPLSFPNHGI